MRYHIVCIHQGMGSTKDFGLGALNKKDSPGWGLCKGQSEKHWEKKIMKAAICSVWMADSEVLKWGGGNVKEGHEFDT